MAIDQALPEQGERQLFTQAFRQFKGVYTKSSRTAMPEDHFYNLENLMPVGPANLQTVPNPSTVLNDFGADIIYLSEWVQIGNTSFQILLSSSGKVFSYNWGSNTVAQINVGHLLSGFGSNLTQWMNQYVLFIDSTGYYSWDGTTFTLLNGANQPVAGADICVYAGRVWVANGRLITYTSAYDGTGTNNPVNNTAWLTANGASFVNMTDPTLAGNITRLTQQNGYLYIFGSTCIYAISDVYIPTGANPPTPVFTITNVQAIIGTDQPMSVFPYNRALMFANKYGAWALSGVNAQRISEDIDGTWQYLAFSPPISGGQCVVNNILCAAFLCKRANDPVFGNNTVIAMWFDSKWWFANLGAVTVIATAVISGVPVLSALIGNKLYKLFVDTTGSPNTVAMTPLWSMDDPLSDKVVIRAGFEMSVTAFGGSATAAVDGTSGSYVFPSSSNTGVIVFLNNSGQAITFVGSGPIIWTTGSYFLQSGYPPGMWNKYVGMTITSTALSFQLSSFFLDYKKGKRW